MIFLRRLLRLAAIGFVFVYSIAEVILTRPRTRPQRAAWISRFCRRVLRCANVTWTRTGPLPTEGAVISNHLTFLDILVHACEHPTVFVSKAELRQVPLLGWISMMAGTVYVARGAGGQAAKAAEGMAKGFRDHLPVTFFPEGGTFDHNEPLLPFRSGLLAETLAAGATVTPSYLRYKISQADQARGRTLTHDVYLASRDLLPQVWRVVGLDGIQVAMQFAPGPIAFPPEAYQDRKLAAQIAHDCVLALSSTTSVAAPIAVEGS